MKAFSQMCSAKLPEMSEVRICAECQKMSLQVTIFESWYAKWSVIGIDLGYIGIKLTVFGIALVFVLNDTVCCLVLAWC